MPVDFTAFFEAMQMIGDVPAVSHRSAAPTAAAAVRAGAKAKSQRRPPGSMQAIRARSPHDGRPPAPGFPEIPSRFHPGAVRDTGGSALPCHRRWSDRGRRRLHCRRPGRIFGLHPESSKGHLKEAFFVSPQIRYIQNLSFHLTCR